MTNEQYIEKMLIDYKVSLEGMLAENKQRELNGFSPAYVERHFQELIFKHHKIIMEFQK